MANTRRVGRFHSENELIDYLGGRFNTPDDACAWYKMWRDELDQEIPNFRCELMGHKSMAAICSLAIEGKRLGPGEGVPSYRDTAYGARIWLTPTSAEAADG